MSRLKTSSSKSAKTSSSSTTSGYDKTKRRKKKATPRRSASSAGISSPTLPPLAPSSPLAITAPSGMRNSISSSTGSPSAGTPTSSRECEQCGNPSQLEIGANAKAVANTKKVAQSGCHVCDFVAYRKALRHCVVCDKTQCDMFCDWCGHGFHTKCAKARGEQIDATANGFCCKKCEAEQADGESDDDDDANEINAKCGECHRPFNSTAVEPATVSTATTKKAGDNKAIESSTDATGFKVNQSVLVENDEVLYNAVITDVDAKNERVKIHFLRWSKSFDIWYAMDDERINESLACDCCNRWFHIGCLPPIKSSGRFKDTTYVCPSCLDDAKGFYSGTRTTATSTKSSKATSAIGSTAATTNATNTTTTSSNRRKAASNGDDAVSSAASSSKKRSTKLIVQSESEEEEDEDDRPEPEPVRSKVSKKASEKENIRDENMATVSKSKKRRRANSVESVGSNGSDKRAKAAPLAASSSPVKKSESDANGKRGGLKFKRGDRSASPEVDEETKDHEIVNHDDQETKAQTVETRVQDKDVSMEESVGEPSGEASNAPANETKSIPIDALDASKAPSEDISQATAGDGSETLTMDKPVIKRKVSGHSVSSLLNSPSLPPRESPPLGAQTPTPTQTIPATASSGSSVRVKMEKDSLAPPATHAKKTAPTRSKVWVTGRDAKTAKAAAAATCVTSTTSGTSATSNRSAPLSAFDILREVAAQSMSDETTLPPPPTTTSRRSQKPRMTAAERKALLVKHESDKAVGFSATSTTTSNSNSTTNGRTPPMPSSSSSIGVGIPMNSYVDLHFAIRKEMYLRICLLEDERLLERETAQLLRAMIYPTSDKFHDLKFVYVVNKDLSSLQLTKRLLELVPITSGGTAPVIPMRPAMGGMGHMPPHPPHAPPGASSGLFLTGSATSSAAPSPARPSTGNASANASANANVNAHASPAPKGYTTPARIASPAIDSTTSSNHHHHHQPEREPMPMPTSAPHPLFHLPTSIGFAAAVERARPLGPLATGSTSVSSILTSVISPSSVIGPPMPPPSLSTKLLLETMHKHSKFPTLLPPPPLGSSSVSSVSSAVSTSASAVVSSATSSASTSSIPVLTSPSTTVLSSSPSSSPAPSSISTTVVASSATPPSPAATAPSKPVLEGSSSPPSPLPPSAPPATLVTNISASISSN